MTPATGVLALAVALLTAAPALGAAPDRSPYVPGGLTATVGSPHFVLHYNPATPSPAAGLTIDQYAQQGAADFEEAFGRDVAGGELTPNAGLPAPTADDDGRTDVYLSAPKSMPEFHGGIVFTDSLPWASSYMFMTPDLSRTGFRFRAAHEFMHVIQNAYTYRIGDSFGEAFANWAAEWALPDVDPLDSNFYGDEYPHAPHPWLPLDCTYESWKGNPCGNGYWQWLFVQAQVEDFGPAFVAGYYQRFAATLDGNVEHLLEAQIQASSGGAQSLRGRFAAYAVKVWDPTRWSAHSLAELAQEGTQPAATYVGRGSPDTGTKSVAVDHLAARYVAERNIALYASAGDSVTLSWTRPAGMAGNVEPLVKRVGEAGWHVAASVGGAEGSVTVPFGPDVEEVVLPLVNDSLSSDDAPFTYRVQNTLAPEPKRPRTRISRHPPRHTHSRLARFLFKADEASRFECRLDRARRYRRCPARYRVAVKPGRHLLSVRAVNRAGLADRSPARWAWTVLATGQGAHQGKRHR
ncbi:MAG TPA: hypothetical protein VG518_03510 [Solirubrobacterales bacterium]|nr:hypothetical protein [Solirubrobacterales bacterium]